MHRYSTEKREDMAFAQAYDVNVSYKDLCNVCNAIRHRRVGEAFQILDDIVTLSKPILFLRYNKYMGARHELHGRKGAYPVSAAKAVKKVLTNALANSKSMGFAPETSVVAHAASNKTHIERRGPSKGTNHWGRGTYGMSAAVHSDIEYAKIEIAIAQAQIPTDEKPAKAEKKEAVKKMPEKTEMRKIEGKIERKENENKTAVNKTEK